MTAPKIRKGQADWPIPRALFEERMRERFRNPDFKPFKDDIEQLIEIAWKSYKDSNKSPYTQKAGEGYANPGYDLSVDWLKAQKDIAQAQRHHEDKKAPVRILLICAASRNDKSCPGEMSKTFRLAKTAEQMLRKQGCEVDLLDLSLLTSEYGRVIYPCKACVSTAMPLCHWPCSCYPNHALGQVNDWMNEIYPLWVAAHGIMIITPVYWYQAPSGLKLMMDRLVCADGGNPDPTSTEGKDVKRAKELELKGWNYPKHLAGRAFSVVVHADTEGADILRRSLVDWLHDMHLVQAGAASTIDRYVGYYEPYATSHDALDKDSAFQEEVSNAALSLANKVKQLRQGIRAPDDDIKEPRPK